MPPAGIALIDERGSTRFIAEQQIKLILRSLLRCIPSVDRQALENDEAYGIPVVEASPAN
jgi:hypothetical protein